MGTLRINDKNPLYNGWFHLRLYETFPFLYSLYDRSYLDLLFARFLASIDFI